MIKETDSITDQAPRRDRLAPGSLLAMRKCDVKVFLREIRGDVKEDRLTFGGL